ncbi:DSBA-like thioredoxin domain-containing protein, partial [Parachaetomium inaequale]
MAKFTFEIDVYSDPICPWCYIGQETLDKAMASYTAQHPDAEFKLTWKPYMLWPNVGVSAHDKGAALRAIYGPSTPSMLARLDRLGAQYGIDFKWEGKTGNSRDAHKLILLAMEQDAAAAATTPSPPEEPTTPPTPN